MPVRLRLKGVRAHWNRHLRCWSVRRGRRLRHMKSLTLVRVRFKVYERGRQRALREGVRNVHAYACGDVLGPAEPHLVGQLGMTPVSYNPYRKPGDPASFYDKATNDDVGGALMLMMLADGTVYAYDPDKDRP